MSGLAVAVRGANRTFGSKVVLDDLDLEVRRGEFLAVLGASGTGKTTLLRVLAGLERLDAGEVLVPRTSTVVFQEPRLVNSKRVWQNVVVGLRGQRGGRSRAEAALAEVGLADKADGWPSTLSGGEAQRVALARALVREPELLLLDEPLAALDALTRIAMQDLLVDLWTAHRPAVLLVTHDVEEALVLADRVVVLEAGRVAVDVAVGFPRPRVAAGAPFDALKVELLAALGVHA